MDDTQRDRNRERLEALPEHEDDRDVEDQAGAGILASGGTALDRGTGDRTGIAQGPAAGEGTAEPGGGAGRAGDPAHDPTPGILGHTDPRRAADDGAAGRRDPDLNPDT